MSEKRQLILDVDTGTDDAIAIMAALLSPEFEVLGICTVSGNLPLANTTENTLRVVSLLAPQVPVIRGCAGPIVRDLDPRRKYCDNEEVLEDEDGNRIAFHVEEFDGLPPARIAPAPTNAVCWMVETLRAATKKVDLVLVGPLTNFALALRADPSIVEHVGQIVIMGGGCEERNSTSAAEFNFFMDPEAAQIVLGCGAKIVLVTLDATHHAVLCGEDVQRMRSWHTTVGDFVAQITSERIKAYTLFQPLFKPDSASMHDALCILYLLDGSVITKTRLLPVSVDFYGGASDGRSVMDTRSVPARAPNCTVCLGTDDEKFSRMLLDILGRAKG